MPYLYLTPEDETAMLAAIGAGSIDDLFAMVPPEMRLERPLAIPPAMTEIELTQHMTALAAKNEHANSKICFLGGGSYDHFIPAAVDELAGRGEFYTSYTPYQAEVSQGNLQVVFEYQSLITRLTGLDVSNASLYDGGSAAAEAVLMAVSSTKRYGKVVTAASVHPEYRQTIATYLKNLGVELVTIGTPDGVIKPQDLAAAVDENTACIVVQQPNFFGCIEDAASLATIAHDAGALVVAAFDPISLGLLKRPGDWGADIAVAEGHTLGTPMQYGGPYLGIMACREKLVRRMPGRIAGETVDRRGKRCFVLTLQTREQHIRREKATSNVCTNQGLFALRATIYLSLLGPQGLKRNRQPLPAKIALRRRATLQTRPLRAGLRRTNAKRIRHPRPPRPRRRTARHRPRRRLPRRRAARPVVSRTERLLPDRRDGKANQAGNRCTCQRTSKLAAMHECH